jgi:hypothetical protein
VKAARFVDYAIKRLSLLAGSGMALKGPGDGVCEGGTACAAERGRLTRRGAATRRSEGTAEPMRVRLAGATDRR